MNQQSNDVFTVLTPHGAKSKIGFRPDSNVVYLYPKNVPKYRPPNEPKWIQRRVEYQNIVAVYLVRSQQQNVQTRVGYRRLNAANISGNEAVVDSSTYSLIKRIQSQYCDCHSTHLVVIRPIAWYMRPYCVFRMNWSHPDDAARIAFKLGMIGLILAVIALAISWKSIIETFNCLFGK